MVNISLGRAICDALGLPKQTVSFTLSAGNNNALTVEAHILICEDKEREVIELLKRYELVEIQDDNPGAINDGQSNAI